MLRCWPARPARLSRRPSRRRGQWHQPHHGKLLASNTGTNSWEEDILGVDTLAAGDTANIDVDDSTGACHFDFKAVFDDGTSSVAHDINVCTTVSYTYTEE